MPIWKFIVAGLLLIASCQAASAAAVKAFTVQSWSGSAFVNDKTRQFEYCSAASKNESGMTMSYSVDRQWAWKLAFSSPNWGFAAGHAFNVTLKIGEEEYRSQRALVTGERNFEMQVGDPIALFERLRTGRNLRVQAGGLSLVFDLVDSDEAIYALVRCVVQQMPRRQTPKVPATASARPLPLTPTTGGDARSEAQALAREILTQLAVADYRFIAPSELPFAYRPDAAWKKGPIVGTVSILPAERATTADTLANEILGSSSQACRDRFFLIAASETIDQVQASRVFTLCRSPQGPITSYYLAVPRSEGGFYLVASINTGFEFLTSRPAEDLDNKLRPIILGVIARQKENGSATEPQ